jgi:2-dehydro-3-deoxyglucarate aldolase
MISFRAEKIQSIQQKLKRGEPSIGSWLQIPHPSIAEILGQSGYDWIAVDLEHGSISTHQLPDLFRALELGGTLPLARLAQGQPKDCKQALDAGAGGIIVPMVENAEQLHNILNASQWPPAGNRGVGFSRANLFGKNFTEYAKEAQSPLLVAQLEHIRAVENLEEILSVKGLDAVFVGPYDLSASMGLTGEFEHASFKKAMNQVLKICKQHKISSGIHVVQPDPNELRLRIDEGHRFIAYSVDSVFLTHGSQSPYEMN